MRETSSALPGWSARLRLRRPYQPATPVLRPDERRCRDERCPSGSSWGEALASGRHLRVRRASGAGGRRPKGNRANGHEKREAPRANAPGPWLVKPRLALSGRPSKARKGGAREDVAASPRSAVEVVDGFNPVGSAQAGRAASAEQTGDWSILRLCSWVDRIAEVDEKRSTRRPFGYEDAGSSQHARHGLVPGRADW